MKRQIKHNSTIPKLYDIILAWVTLAVVVGLIMFSGLEWWTK